MAIVAVFEFPNDPVDKYEQVFQAGGPPILEQPGRIHHVCYRTETGFTVVDVWADEQSFAAFGQVISPATQQAGLDAEPMVYPVQGMISHDGQQSR
jgi:heme-degrading monooxygenase HmoA